MTEPTPKPELGISIDGLLETLERLALLGRYEAHNIASIDNDMPDPEEKYSKSIASWMWFATVCDLLNTEIANRREIIGIRFDVADPNEQG